MQIIMILSAIFFVIGLVLLGGFQQSSSASSYDRQISVLSCIKIPNSCGYQDNLTIRNMCHLFVKGINTFPKGISPDDIMETCHKQVQNMNPPTRDFYIHTYGEDILDILENKFNIMKLMDDKYPGMRFK